MYDAKTDTASWSGDGGTLFVDFKTGEFNDGLDHGVIVESYERGEALPPSAPTLREEYERIGSELLDDGRNGEYLGYGMDYTETGVVYENGDDWRLTLEPTGVRFEIKDEGRPGAPASKAPEEDAADEPLDRALVEYTVEQLEREAADWRAYSRENGPDPQVQERLDEVEDELERRLGRRQR